MGKGMIRENQNDTLSPNERLGWMHAENIYWDFWRKVERALLYGFHNPPLLFMVCN